MGGKARVTQTQSEDANAVLASAPYTTGNLYARFVVNFSLLPGGAGGYFAHFKDATTSGFRCRVFASITGAEAGKFRVGILNGASATAPVLIPTDLELNTDYILVIRYAPGTVASTLWINPTAETDTANRAVAVDSVGALAISTFGLRQSLSSGDGMGTLLLDDLKVGTAFTDVVEVGAPTLNPPSITSIPNQSLPRNGSTPAIPFTVNDGETAPAALTVAAMSSNTPLVPVANIVFGGSGSNCTVTVTPLVGEQGTSKITITVTDGNMNTASREFLVIVGAPTVSAFSELEIPRNGVSPAIPFTVTDGESDPLTFSAISTNETVVPVSGIAFGGSGSSRTVTITPTAGQAGLSRVTVIVSDGFNTTSNSFVVTVFPEIGSILSDTFAYPDGPLTSSSSFVWNNHSGTANQVMVQNGQVRISSTNSEDVNAFLGVTSYPPSGGWILYASFTVKFTARPTGSGGYFAHFRNLQNSFGARVFAVTNGAAPGKLRLGISNNSGSPSSVWASDLDTNTTYTVVTRMNVGTGASKLWVNPASEISTSIAAADSAFPFEVNTYAFRQDSGIGESLIDDFRSGTAFSDVVEIKPALTITATGNNVTLSWPASASAAGYVLRYTDSFPAAWADFFDQGNPQGDQMVLTLNGVTDNRFFELRKP